MCHCAKFHVLTFFSTEAALQRCSKNMQLYWNHNLAWVFSRKFPTYLWTSFPKNTSGRLLFHVLYLRNVSNSARNVQHFMKVTQCKIQTKLAFTFFKVNNENTGKMCEICARLTKGLERRQWRRSGLFVVNFEQFHLFFSVSIDAFEHLVVCWKARFRLAGIYSFTSQKREYTSM